MLKTTLLKVQLVDITGTEWKFDHARVSLMNDQLTVREDCKTYTFILRNIIYYVTFPSTEKEGAECTV